jgi:hypothetical protein
MRLFDQKGMMVFPNPEKRKEPVKMKELLVIRFCCCSEGHNLVSDQAMFDDFAGILLKARKAGEVGQVALSPVYGVKHRISLGIKLEKDDLLEILCPECGQPLPVFSACSCGGSLVALFLDEKKDFTNCILICSRVGCHNAKIRLHNEIINYDDNGHVVFR